MRTAISVLILSVLAWTAHADDYSAGVSRWNNLKAKQAAPCNPSVDSKEVLLGHKTSVSVLILHGYSQNPEAMSQYIEYFKRFQVNILAPRLLNHFDTNLNALDSV